MEPLTFGIEFEFCLATLQEGASDPDPHNFGQVYGIICKNEMEHVVPGMKQSLQATQAFLRNIQAYDVVQKHLADTLSGAGFPAITDQDLRQEYAAAEMNGTQDKHVLKYDTWHVTTDGSICPPGEFDDDPENEYEWYKIELISPILVFSPEAIQQVKTICQLFQQKYRTLTNESCGLHVHVGQGTNGLPDYAIKSLMATIWTFEDRLDLLHPEHRINGEACNSLYNWSPLALAQTSKPLLLREQLEIILNCKTGDDVIELTNSESANYGWAYNAWNLRSQFAGTTKRTIEFRQHEGTLNPKPVENWIKVCVGLVEFARMHHPNSVARFLKAVIDEDRYTAENFLLDIGLPKQAKFYESKLWTLLLS